MNTAARSGSHTESADLAMSSATAKAITETVSIVPRACSTNRTTGGSIPLVATASALGMTLEEGGSVKVPPGASGTGSRGASTSAVAVVS